MLCITQDGFTVDLPLPPDNALDNQEFNKDTDSEDFTSDSDAAPSDEEENAKPPPD